MLAVPYRHKLFTPELLAPLAAVAVVLGAILVARWDFFEQVLRSRVDTSARGTSTHFDVYAFVPDVLTSNPFFGLGLNNFSVYYEFVTGRTNFGPHSFYVATIVETGLIGTALFVAFLWHVFRRLGRLRAIGRALASPRIRPLAWGMTAALVGTIAANAFYLTMSFYYFFAFAMLALAAPIVFARRLSGEPRGLKPVPEQRPEDAQAVQRRQLLAGLARPRLVADRHFVDADAAAQQLRRDLRLDPEAALAQVERAEELQAHRLVAGHHVRDPAVVDHVARQRDRLVPDHVPEVVRGV